jgi:hypothetical protein
VTRQLDRGASLPGGGGTRNHQERLEGLRHRSFRWPQREAKRVR